MPGGVDEGEAGALATAVGEGGGRLQVAADHLHGGAGGEGQSGKEDLGNVVLAKGRAKYKLKRPMDKYLPRSSWLWLCYWCGVDTELIFPRSGFCRTEAKGVRGIPSESSLVGCLSA